MTQFLRFLALAAIALSVPACATEKKPQASCCSAGSSSQCAAPTAKKKAN